MISWACPCRAGLVSAAGHIPFTPGAKKTLELSLREALQLGDSYIGTEHLLLGLIRQDEGPAAQALRELSVDLDTTRAEIIRLHPERPSTVKGGGPVRGSAGRARVAGRAEGGGPGDGWRAGRGWRAGAAGAAGRRIARTRMALSPG